MQAYSNSIMLADSTHVDRLSLVLQGVGGLHGMELRNKPPHWNESLRCWCLNFRGRVKLASVKNFQLIASNDPSKTIVMQACSHQNPLPCICKVHGCFVEE